MTTSTEKFHEATSKTDFVFAIFFRGHWCPFCMAWLKDLETLIPQIHASNGEAIAITAEPEPLCDKTIATTRFSGVLISDPNIELAHSLKGKGLVDVAVSEKSGYAHGMIQPGILVLDKEGKAVFSWAIVPGAMNIGGAKDRPVLAEVWADVRDVLEGKKTEVRSRFSTMGFGALLRQKMFG